MMWALVRTIGRKHASAMQNVQLTHAQHRPTPVTLPVCFLAHDIDIPLNVGTLFRIADALGVERIHLSGASPVPPDPKIRKTSRSTEDHVAWSYAADPLQTVAALKAAGYRIVALELTTLSVDIRALPVASADRICLVLGSENRGVCQELLDVCDATAHIPMFGQNSSMNVGNACAIATFELVRRFLPCPNPS